jgi:hypothetical protein
VIIDEQTEPWGIKVSIVEVKDVEMPDTMQRAMARQAEAEREKRAKIIHAEGEFQASKQLAQAARIIGTQPATLQLRYLETLTEIATEKNSTIIFPLPIDLLTVFLEQWKGPTRPAPAEPELEEELAPESLSVADEPVVPIPPLDAGTPPVRSEGEPSEGEEI